MAVLTYPDGKTVTYSYDAANRLTSVTDWAGRVTNYTYDAAGRLTQTTRPNGTSQVRTYDSAGQLTGLSELGPGGTTTIYSEACAYDGDSRLGTETLAPSQVTGPARYVTGTYGYDADNRVTSWKDTLSDQTACTYDAAANLLGETDQFAAPPINSQVSETFDHDNRLLTYSGQAASFDADGNLLSLPGAAPASYAYDARGRLVSADTLGYTYNSEGNRTAVTGPTGTTQFVVNPNAALSQVLVSKAPNGTVTDYVYGLGLAYSDTGGAGSYYHYDRRGDTVALTNDSAAVLGHITYGIYGQIVSATGQTNTPFLFNGLYGVMTDSNGLYYHRARYYSPQLRRFVTQDVNLGGIALATSMNRYAYANGNPVNAIDPFGLMAADLNPGGSDWAVLAALIDSLLQDDLAAGPALTSADTSNAPPSNDSLDSTSTGNALKVDVTLANGGMPKGWDPSWPSGTDERGPYVQDPTTGTKWYPHPEDSGHWPHWDDDDGKRYPEDSLKPWPGQQRPPYGDQSSTNPWVKPEPSIPWWVPFVSPGELFFPFLITPPGYNQQFLHGGPPPMA